MTKEGYLKHRDLIEEWAKGSKIEFYCDSSESWFTTDDPAWNLNIKYRLEKSKPKWEDFGKVSGYYIYTDTDQIRELKDVEAAFYNKSVFPTIVEAEACLALSQLCQWRDMYNDGWKPDWRFYHEDKYVIYIEHNEITTGIETLRKCVLAFKTEEIRDKFLEDFRDLIETANPLL